MSSEFELYDRDVRKRFHVFTRTKDTITLDIFTTEEQTERLAQRLAFWMMEEQIRDFTKPMETFFTSRALIHARRTVDSYPQKSGP